MPPRAALALAGVLALALPRAASAQPAPRAFALALGLTLRADRSAAERQMSLRRDEIIRCLDEAADRAPDRLATLRRVLVTLRLDRRGRATVVELDPPLLSPGLSECLARTLLGWDQGGRPAARAVVQLQLSRG